MKNLVWLASYPKSGNTWFRIVLSNLLRDPKEGAVQINQIGAGMNAASRSHFDGLMGVKASDLSPRLIQSWRTKVFESMSELHGPEPLFMKIHDCFSRDPKGRALIPLEKTRQIIYLVRNPLDVCVSLAHHLEDSMLESCENLCDPDWGLCNKPEVLYNQLHQHLNTWSQHVRSWLDTPDLPLHLLRFEDLKADPYPPFARAFEAAGLSFTEKRLRLAIEASELEKLQEQERAHGFVEKLRSGSAPFFRKGEAGAWREVLGQSQIQRIKREHGEMMRRLGYLDESLACF